MDADVIIVGSGLLGAVCAKNLAEKGLGVLMLERGAIISSPAGQHLRNQEKYHEDPNAFFNEINQWCHQFDDKAQPQGLPGANLTHAYGGQGLLWTNNCPRLREHERWPEYDEKTMQSLYLRAEKILRVSTNLFDDSSLQDYLIQTLEPHLTSQHRHIAKVPTAAKKFKDNRIEYTATKQILNDSLNSAKSLSIRTNCQVLEIIHEKNHVKQILIRQDGKISSLKAKIIVVAAGVFDSAQLLYDSNMFLPALGKYLHFHPLLFAQIICNDASKCNDIPPRTCIYPTAQYPWHAMLLRDIFPDIAKEDVPNHLLLELQFFLPIDVQEKNQMIFNKTMPTFDVTLSAQDKNMIKAAEHDLRSLAKMLGRYRKGCEPFSLDFGFTHPMGITRMGDEKKTSVTNFKGKVHGFDNLYLATVGLIPTKLAVNPTLTAAAIALATTDSIAKTI
jgi:C-glycoside oxidase